jgi:membrane dipeptidase
MTNDTAGGVATGGTDERGLGSDPAAIHRSTIVVNGLDPSSLRVEYLDLLKAGGVSCWVGADGNGLAYFAATRRFCEEHPEKIVFAESVRDIRQAYRDRKIAYIAPWQDASILLDSGVTYAPAIGILGAYHALGLRICGIAYNLANDFGGGCLEPEIGLTLAGRRLVEQVHKLRIVLDVGGHTGEKTSLDALAMSAGVPVVCTHTNVRALNDNPRCTSDKVLEGIAASGGVVGVCAFNDFLARTRNDAQVRRTPQVGLDRYLDQFDYLRKLIGVDHIGLGPDFIEGRPGLDTPVSEVRQQLMPPEAYSPERPWYYVKGFERISELPNVTRGLMNRGWSIAQIRKVLGENWLRVYEQVWGR